MSGSFWKFGQDFSTQSPLSKVLNRAFIKIDGNTAGEVQGKTDASVTDESLESNSFRSDDEEELECELPNTEEEYKNYKPNLYLLDDLLDDEELYTELMCSNFKLLIYLKYPEVLSKLIDYVRNNTILDFSIDRVILEGSDLVYDKDKDTTEDLEHDRKGIESRDVIFDKKEQDHDDREEIEDEEDDNASEDTRVTLPPEMEEHDDIRRARIAAEVLSADVWPISSALIENEDLLTKLWSILSHPAPLSIEASTYFMKINERLLDMDMDGIIEFILKMEHIVNDFLTHIDNPPLMDFLLKVISTDKPEVSNGIIQMFKRQNLVSKLVHLLDPKFDSSTQSAAGDFLKALVTISGNCPNEITSSIGPNELTRQLVSPNMMKQLMDIMIKGGTSLNNGVGIIIELIRKNNSDYDTIQANYTTIKTHPPTDRDPIYLGYLVKLFSDRMPEFNKVLTEKKISPLKTSYGTIEPLGFERFKICELIAELLHCSNMTLLNESNGYSIVRERDAERERIFNAENHANSNDYNEPKEDEDGNKDDVDKEEDDNANQLESAGTSIDGEEVIDKLNSLQIETNKVDQRIRNEEEDGLAPDFNSAHLQDEENENPYEPQYSDVILDSSSVEKEFRVSPNIGDQLKIALQDTRVIDTMLEMFFHFRWNNFLHNVVYDVIQQIFNGPLKIGYNRFLLSDLLTNIHLTDMIINGNNECIKYEEAHNSRLGYMGHLTLIAEEITKFTAYIEEMNISFENTEVMDSLFESKWIKYTEDVLEDLKEKYNAILGDIAEEGDILDDEEDGAIYDKAAQPGSTVDDYINDIMQMGNVRGQREEDDDDDDDEAEEYDSFDEDESQGYCEENSIKKTTSDPAIDEHDQSQLYYEYVSEDGTKTRLNFNPGLDSTEHDSEELDNDNKIPLKLKRSFTDACKSEIIIQDTIVHTEEENGFQMCRELNDDWESSPSNSLPKRASPSKNGMNSPVYRHQFELHSPSDENSSYRGKMSSADDNDFEIEEYDELSDDSDDSDEDYDNCEDEEDLNGGTSGAYALCRSKSKDKISWDEEEQARLMGVVKFNSEHYRD
ncbi:sap185p [Saccharomyces arboricola H-6]|uniref:Sap185p n=1 Tax=Saccharomyces arboricola (strain H-6 / AS 2.3317 / CBS 10644) TaxID=1160507 RepID=J8Q6D0_SACAR|nr:sap185p [Saccharomyces arboricola H-6]